MRANRAKFLGVVVDEELSFKFHIENVARKLTFGIGFLYRDREVLGHKELLLLYNTLLLPHLDCCSLVWGINYLTNSHKLRILQKREVRIILGLGYSDPVLHVFRELLSASASWGPVFRRYLLNGLMDQNKTWTQWVSTYDLVFFFKYGSFHVKSIKFRPF